MRTIFSTERMDNSLKALSRILQLKWSFETDTLRALQTGVELPWHPGYCNGSRIRTHYIRSPEQSSTTVSLQRSVKSKRRISLTFGYKKDFLIQNLDFNFQFNSKVITVQLQQNSQVLTSIIDCHQIQNHRPLVKITKVLANVVLQKKKYFCQSKIVQSIKKLLMGYLNMRLRVT